MWGSQRHETWEWLDTPGEEGEDQSGRANWGAIFMSSNLDLETETILYSLQNPFIADLTWAPGLDEQGDPIEWSMKPTPRQWCGSP